MVHSNIMEKGLKQISFSTMLLKSITLIKLQIVKSVHQDVHALIIEPESGRQTDSGQGSTRPGTILILKSKF